MGEIEQKLTPASRLGAPENSGISTLERGQKAPPTPSGKLMTVKIQMLDDTQEAFEVPQRATGKEGAGVGLRSRGHTVLTEEGVQSTHTGWMTQTALNSRGLIPSLTCTSGQHMHIL